MYNISKYNSPFKTLSLLDELNNWDSLLGLSRNNLSRTPAIDVVEDEKGFSVKADIPDYEKEDINISLDDGELTISGQKNKEEKEDTKNYIRRERVFSSFQKVVRLNEDIDIDGIKASLKNGVLDLSLPKKMTKKVDRKKINVE